MMTSDGESTSKTSQKGKSSPCLHAKPAPTLLLFDGFTISIPLNQNLVLLKLTN